MYLGIRAGGIKMKKYILSILLSILLIPSIAFSWGDSPFGPVPPDNTAYNAAAWDNSLLAPTQNAVRDWIVSIGGGLPGGLDTQLQYNDAGAFAGDASMTFDDILDYLVLTGGIRFPNATSDGISFDDAGGTVRSIMRVDGGDDLHIGSGGLDDIYWTVGSAASTMHLAETTGKLTVRGSGGIDVGIADSVPGDVILHDEGRLTLWDDGNDFSVYMEVTDGTTHLRLTGNIDVSGDVIVGSDVSPDSSDGASIGTVDREWSDEYLADEAIIYFGDNQDVTLTHVHDTGLTTNLNFAAATYGAGGDVSDADLLSINDGAATTIAVGGGVGSPIAWGTDIPTAVTIGTKYIYRADGTDVPVADGGTGASTAANGFDALSPLTVAGGIIYGGASGTGTELAAGATTTVLVGGGAAAPVWTTATGTGAPVRAGSPTFTTQITAPIIALTGGQIAFPATAVPSADANTLDDYEEGTWTPSLGGNTTYTKQTGQYIKVGRHVTLWGQITVNALGTGSTTTVTGNTITASVTSTGGAVSYYTNLATNCYSITPDIASSGTSIWFNLQTALDNANAIQGAIFGDGASIRFMITFRAAT